MSIDKFLNFCAAHLPVRLDMETKLPTSKFGHAWPKKEIQKKKKLLQFYFMVMFKSFGHIKKPK